MLAPQVRRAPSVISSQGTTSHSHISYIFNTAQLNLSPPTPSLEPIIPKIDTIPNPINQFTHSPISIPETDQSTNQPIPQLKPTESTL